MNLIILCPVIVSTGSFWQRLLIFLLILRKICLIHEKKLTGNQNHEIFGITCHLLYNSISNVWYCLNHQCIWILDK